jgi:hypothetical protein
VTALVGIGGKSDVARDLAPAKSADTDILPDGLFADFGRGCSRGGGASRPR